MCGAFRVRPFIGWAVSVRKQILVLGKSFRVSDRCPKRDPPIALLLRAGKGRVRQGRARVGKGVIASRSAAMVCLFQPEVGLQRAVSCGMGRLGVHMQRCVHLSQPSLDALFPLAGQLFSRFS